jgi:hypothetical protein
VLVISLLAVLIITLDAETETTEGGTDYHIEWILSGGLLGCIPRVGERESARTSSTDRHNELGWDSTNIFGLQTWPRLTSVLDTPSTTTVEEMHRTI